MYTANIYRVMIASPGDVADERKAAREIIIEWNDVHSFKQKIILIPAMWEFNTIPAVGKSPQTHVNEQMLSDVDLLVAIFSTKLGTPTEHYSSGSVEELELQIKANKPAMLYFSNANISRDKLMDPQFRALEEFKKGYQGKSLYKTYSDLRDFKDQFRDHLAKAINVYPQFIGFSKTLNILQAETKKYELTIFSHQILYCAADGDGDVLVSESKEGLSIQVGNHELVRKQAPQLVAKWRSSIEYLYDMKLLHKKSRSLYSLSDTSYKYVENDTSNFFLPEKSIELLSRAGSYGELKIFDNGYSFQIIGGSSHMVPEQNAREIAEFKASIVELLDKGLVDKAGNSLKLTKKGYRYFDELGLNEGVD